MKRLILSLIVALTTALCATAQTVVRVYDENIDPMAQIDAAIAEAQQTGRYVVCQLGGNWCKWCLRFADFITKDEEIASTISANFVYRHVNLPKRQPEALLERLGQPARFGYPVMIVLDSEGKVVHIQDSSLLEEGEGYDRKKVLRFFNNWTPSAVNGKK